jgi:hypothetical protein
LSTASAIILLSSNSKVLELAPKPRLKDCMLLMLLFWFVGEELLVLPWGSISVSPRLNFSKCRLNLAIEQSS